MAEEQSVLGEELATYYENKAALLADHPGHYVLIKGSEIIRVFESQRDALNHGVSEYPQAPFLVRQILAVEATASYTSNLLAI